MPSDVDNGFRHDHCNIRPADVQTSHSYLGWYYLNNLCIYFLWDRL